ncbi:MAG: DEAD/DEAH box helicase [Actinomycetales bacterium]|nr:DEAD/DEAH box helicase [Actinomycetales bacterium]
MRDRSAALLADDMGLGKTITALAASQAAGAWKILVVCPTVVLWNWKAEAEKWLVWPRVQVVADGRVEIDPDADVVVVTHGLLLRPWILSQLAAVEWDVLIVDEAHAFKSPGAKRTVALYGTLAPCAEKVWLLTGTPCPNNVSELHTHLAGIAPERLMDPKLLRPLTHDRFIERFCLWRWTEYGKKITGNRKDRLEELKARLEGFVLRRKKAEVLPDLPPVRFETVFLRPLKLDRALAALDSELAPRIRDAVAGATDASEVFEALKDGEEFARFRRLCGVAKAHPVADLLHAELDEGGLEKVVVFAHHKDVVEDIAARLSRFGVRTITGATSAEARAERVADFQTSPLVRVMVCNIVAGGVGVTLTAASEVVFAEQSWVPGDNAQAADRCHRIGQTRRVRVRFMALADTIDEAVTASLRQKARMLREVFGE